MPSDDPCHIIYYKRPNAEALQYYSLRPLELDLAAIRQGSSQADDFNRAALTAKLVRKVRAHAQIGHLEQEPGDVELEMMLQEVHD